MTTPSTNARTIVFGDVHGCHEEWRDLLDAVGPTAGDRLVSVGDLVNKGPSSRKTLELARSLPDFRVVVGNHEQAHIERWRRLERRVDERHLAVLGPDAESWLAWIETWPAKLDDTDPDCIVVHAGLRPDVPLENQTIDTGILPPLIAPINNILLPRIGLHEIGILAIPSRFNFHRGRNRLGLHPIVANPAFVKIFINSITLIDI